MKTSTSKTKVIGESFGTTTDRFNTSRNAHSRENSKLQPVVYDKGRLSMGKTTLRTTKT